MRATSHVRCAQFEWNYTQSDQLHLLNFDFMKQTIIKIVNYSALILSIVGVIFSIILFIEASQPCGSDGCLIHILYIIAIPMFLISGIIFYVFAKKIFKWTNS
jgi:hypothetical protein